MNEKMHRIRCFDIHPPPKKKSYKKTVPMKLKANNDPIDLPILMQWMKVKTCIIKTHVHPKYLFTVCKTFHVDDNNIQ